MNDTSHNDFYAQSKYYDIAFSFKNVAEENSTILKIYEDLNQRQPQSFLDIAAGPANNCADMAERGLKSIALDCSAEMKSYALQKAQEKNIQMDYVVGDMKQFKLPFQADVAAIFMDSLSYLLTNEDVIQHLRSVSQNLNQNGLYFIEMSHPRDVFSVGSSSLTEWTQKDQDVEVKVEWGAASDIFDPITQTTEVTAVLEYSNKGSNGKIVDRSKQRLFTFNEMKALVAASGCFDWVKTLGSFKPETDFTNEKSAWRMIPVLKKK